MATRGIIFRSARTFGTGPAGGAAAQWRRALATRCALHRVGAWRRAGDRVIAVGDDPAGLPDGVEFIAAATLTDAAFFAGLTEWSAWLACGWYRGTGAEALAARLTVDGLDIAGALEHEKVRAAAALLERVRLAQRVLARWPDAQWQVDGAYADLTQCAGLPLTLLLPDGLQRLFWQLEAWHWSRSIRRDFTAVPATGARGRAGARTLVLPLHGLHLQGFRSQIPHLRLLAEDARNELLCIAPLPEVCPLLRAELGAVARVTTWNDYWSPAAAGRARARWSRWLTLLADPELWRARDAAGRYAGLDLAPALARYEAFLHGALAREALRYAALYEEVIRRERPAVLMLTLDNGWRERLLVDVARAAGVPTVVQHNMQPSVYPQTASLRAVVPPDGDRDPQLRLKLPSDRATLMGEAMRAQMTAAGCRPEALRVTGLPRYDGFAERQGKLSRPALRAQFGIPADARVLLLTTQPPSQIDNSTRADRDRVARAVADAVCALPGGYLLLRPHHEEFTHNYAVIIAASGVPGKMAPAAASLFELLAVADAMATCFSTSSFEAIACGVPVLIVNVSGRPDPVAYVEAGAAVGAYGYAAIPDALARAMTPDPRRDAAARAFLAYNIDLREGAAARGAAAVTDLLKEQ